MDSISECLEQQNMNVSFHHVTTLKDQDLRVSISERCTLRIPSENALVVRKSCCNNKRSCPASKVCPLADCRQPCIDTGEKKRELEQDGDGGQEQGQLLPAWEDAVLPLDQLLPAVEGAVGRAKEEAEPAKVGLEHAELPPRQGGGEGGQGGEPEQDGKRVSEDAKY